MSPKPLPAVGQMTRRSAVGQLNRRGNGTLRPRHAAVALRGARSGGVHLSVRDRILPPAATGLERQTGLRN